LLSRLTDVNPERKIWNADALLFLDLADPGALTDPDTHGLALIARPITARQLTDGWRLAFSRVSYDTWSFRAQHWLRRAADDERHRHLLLGVLVDGAERRTSILSRLYAMTRQKELRTTISDLLLQKINTVQAIRPYDRSSGTRGYRE
jgi:hypothetical protein